MVMLFRGSWANSLAVRSLGLEPDTMVRPVCGYNVVVWVLQKLSDGIWTKNKTKTQGEAVSGNPGLYLIWHQSWLKSHFVLLLLVSELVPALLRQLPSFLSLPTRPRSPRTWNTISCLKPTVVGCRAAVRSVWVLSWCPASTGLAGAKQGPQQVIQQQWWVSAKHLQQMESAEGACPKWCNWQPSTGEMHCSMLQKGDGGDFQWVEIMVA